MPRSKRSKVVTLTKTIKKTKADKENLFEAVREAIDTFSNIYIFSVENMRNQFLKDVRQEMKGSGKFFYGRNRVMAKALGASEEEEYKQDLRFMAEKLQGNVGLLFSNTSIEQVQSILENYTQADYARSGCVATKTVVISQGPVTRDSDESKFPHNMEPQLRALGMPTRLVQGVITLDRDYVLCQEGKPLSTEAAHLLKHFHIPMAQFKIELLYQWTNNSFITLKD